MTDTRAPPISKRIREAGYSEPLGILEHIQYTLLENSFQHDDHTELLRHILDATHTTNTLLQSLVNQQQNSREELVNSVNLQILQPIERPSKVLQRALDWLSAHPERLQETSRKLATEIGVSHTTVAKAQQLMKGKTE